MKTEDLQYPENRKSVICCLLELSNLDIQAKEWTLWREYEGRKWQEDYEGHLGAIFTVLEDFAGFYEKRDENYNPLPSYNWVGITLKDEKEADYINEVGAIIDLIINNPKPGKGTNEDYMNLSIYPSLLAKAKEAFNYFMGYEQDNKELHDRLKEWYGYTHVYDKKDA